MSRARTSAGRISTGRISANVVMALMAAYFLLPFWWLLVAATKDNDGLFGSAPLWFVADFNLFENLSLLLRQDGGVYLKWLRNSALYSVASGIGATAIAAGAG